MLIALTCKKIIVRRVNTTRTARMATGTLITGVVCCCGSADCAISMGGSSMEHSDVSVGKGECVDYGLAAGAQLKKRTL